VGLVTVYTKHGSRGLPQAYTTPLPLPNPAITLPFCPAFSTDTRHEQEAKTRPAGEL